MFYSFLTKKTLALSVLVAIYLSTSLGLTRVKITEPEKEKFIRKLIAEMTIDEKVGQLTQFSSDMDQTGASIRENYKKDILEGKVGSIFNAYTPQFARELQDLSLRTRMKIPLLLGYDVIHGHRTIFPIPLAESTSWDLKLLKQTAAVAAKEASSDGIHWTFSPMVDVARDPRWGRIAEGAGEDPWLGAEIAKTKVQGYQGEDLADPDTILACVKHFAFYGAPGGGRDYNTVDMSRRAMFETYLPPYRAAIQAGAGSVMTSFNEVDGIPATANRWLLNDLLRKKWNFNGFIVTDYTAINEMVYHGVAENEKSATYLAARAGVDMDMQGAAYYNHLKALVQEGKITEAQLNTLVYRVLDAKYKLGLFKDPYRGASDRRAHENLRHPKHLALAREIAQKSIVLLKNQNQILPIKTQKHIAVVGPLAKSKRDVIGSWCAACEWQNAISVYQGLEEKAPKYGFTLSYEKGSNLLENPTLIKRLNDHGAMIDMDSRTPQQMIDAAVAIAQNADIILAVMGESHAMSGEAASRAHIDIPENQVDLLKALSRLHKPIVLVLMNGRPLTLTWESENLDAILETWFLGTQAGNAIADVLVGEVNPSGKLTTSFPRSIGQIPIYYSSKNTGRPYDQKNKYTSKYLDEDNDPLYPFGFGLSYSQYHYGELQLNPVKIKKASGEKITVNLNITNTGPYDGEEIVQLYLRDMFASVTRPIKELRNFKKIFLKSGESKLVQFEIIEDDLKFYNEDLKWISEKGEFRVMIGPHSSQLKEASFYLE